MRLSALLVMLVFFPLLGCRDEVHSIPSADAGGPAAPRSDTVRYENCRFGFAVRVPATWTISEESENGDGVHVEIPDLPGVRMDLYGGLNVEEVHNLDDLLALYRELDSMSDLSATRIQVGGLPGIELLEERDGHPAIHRLLLRGGIIYGLYVEAPLEELARAREALDQVAGTFEAVQGLEVTP